MAVFCHAFVQSLPANQGITLTLRIQRFWGLVQWFQHWEIRTFYIWYTGVI